MVAPVAKSDSANSADGRLGLSLRSERLVEKPVLSYIDMFVKAQKEGLWDPEKKKDGWIPLVVAENKLGTSLVLEKLEAVKGYPEAVMNYTNMKGMPECQAAVAGLLERHVIPGHKVDPSHVVLAAGCGALLDALFWCVCDAGDGVLIPAPYYPAFDNDLQAKCGVQPLPFYLDEGEPGQGPAAFGAAIRRQLDGAVVAAAARGIAVRSLLVTNPNNPTGTLYRSDTITEMIKWCLDKHMHYVSDEVYALSGFKPEAQFVSAVALAQQLVPPPPPEMKKQRSRLASFFSRGRGAASSDVSSDSSDDSDDDEAEKKKRKERNAARAAKRAERAAKKAAAEQEAAKRAAEEAERAARAEEQAAAAKANGSLLEYSQEAVDTYVHQLYGLSKDFCASGLRFGSLYTRNARLLKALDPITVFTGVSGHTQWAVAQALGDAEWVDGFLAKNRKLLDESYEALAAALKEEKIPFVPAVAGMFVWIDLRKWLPEKKTWEEEGTFWQRVCEECKIILTPGQSCHAAEPGHFRLCFAWMPPAALKEAVKRLRQRVLEDEEGGECVVQ